MSDGRDQSENSTLAGASPADGGERDRWEWRRRIRANPRSARIYRIAVGVIGLLVVVIGIVLLPFPGPGWLIIFLGLGIWASEFEWAQRLLSWVRNQVEAWWNYLDRKGWWAKALAGVATAVVVLLIFWGLFALSGVPGWFPETVKQWLARLPGLG